MVSLASQQLTVAYNVHLHSVSVKVRGTSDVGDVIEGLGNVSEGWGTSERVGGCQRGPSRRQREQQTQQTDKFHLELLKVVKLEPQLFLILMFNKNEKYKSETAFICCSC